MTAVPIVSSSASPTRSSRDGRIDFVRGLCLIDMVLVHLIVWGVDPGRLIALWLGEYVRFAAGGFVLMSGLTLGVVAHAKLDRGMTGGKLTKWLWHRAAYVLAMHYAATLAFVFLFPVTPQAKALPPVSTVLADILLLRSGTDLLPFYVVMLLITPAVVLATRSRVGTAVVTAASVGVFAWAQQGENCKSFPLPLQQAFFVPLWQMMFVIGLIAGGAWGLYAKARFSWRVTMTVTAWVAVAVLTILAYGAWWGLPISPPIAFWKNPLTAGEAARYAAWTLALLCTADVALWRFDASVPSRFVQRLGRKSLELYVAHVFLAVGVTMIATRLGWVGPVNLIWSALTVAVLWGIATFLEREPARVIETSRPARTLALRGATVAGVAGLVLLLASPWLVRQSTAHTALTQLTVSAADESDFFTDDDLLPMGPFDFQPPETNGDPFDGEAA